MKLSKTVAPMMPLFPDGQGYPEGYQLSARLRPIHSLDIPFLTEVFKKDCLYEVKEDGLDLCVVSVLSPYTELAHVMVAELSPDRYLPGPQFFSKDEWHKLLNLVSRCLHAMENQKHTVQCCGYNWSPNSWGLIEERLGCQSIMTKFHMMVWQWKDIEAEVFNDIPLERLRFLGPNNYNEPFVRNIYELSHDIINSYGFFDEPEYCCRGMILPFNAETNISTILNSNFLYELSKIAEDYLSHLFEIFVEDSLDEIKNILKNTVNRKLTEEELETIRKKPTNRTKEEMLSLCKNQNEVMIVEELYEAVVERCTTYDDQKAIWKKGFGYSLAMIQSSQPDIYKSGLYIGLCPYTGPCGMAETIGCYLLRPEQRLADESLIIKHNHLLWELAKNLKAQEAGSIIKLG